MKRIFTAILGMLFLLGGCSQKESSVTKVDSDEALKLMDEEAAILIDVREESEFVQGHIPNAVLLPLNNMEARIGEVVDDLDTTIIVYCRSGNRSAQAANKLIKLGYPNVYDLGGIGSWKYDIKVED